jgi:hypothetical protein
MEQLREMLEAVRKAGLARGRFRGLLHVLIGRRIRTAAGEVLSTGMSWRDLAGLLKRVRWDRDAVRELKLDPAALPPRDRQKYWYSAIAQANLATAEAAAEGDQLVEPLQRLGFVVGPSPTPSEARSRRKAPPPPGERPGGRKEAQG